MRAIQVAWLLLLCLGLLLAPSRCGSYETDNTIPSSPTDLTCTSPPSDTTPTFAWNTATDDSGVDHYLVNVDSGEVGVWTNVGNVADYTLDDAIGDGSHTFMVRAVDKVGNVGSIVSLTFVIDAAGPVDPRPAISDITACNVTASSATITWTTDEPTVGQVEYGTAASYSSSYPGSPSTYSSYLLGHRVDLTGLTARTTYHYRVRAIDQSGNEATSDNQTFTTSSALPVGQLTVHFIDVGQGDAILLDSGEHEVLIDGGGGDYDVATSLSGHVDGPLEAIVATDIDADHIGGLPEVLNAFEVQQVWHNGTPGSTVTYAAFMSAVGRESADVHVARQGDTITVGSMAFSVLNPAEAGGTSNNDSIVLSLAWGQVDFLFAADAEAEAEGSMVAAGLVHDVDILKVGHHGSRTSSTQPFLAEAKPEVAIYMAGEGNAYGHPHPETIAALDEIGATTYGTNVHGTITVSTDGATYQIATQGTAPPVTPDNTPPVISEVAVSNTTSASATITWTTNEASTSQVEYGPTTSYGSSTPLDSSLATTHSVSLSGLASGTTYHFTVKSTDVVNNESVSQDGTFKTPTAGSAVQITYIFYDGVVSQVESDEYVEIKNLGDTAQDITGWVVKDISDEGSPSLKFPSYVLQPGASIRVYTNEIHPEWGGFSFGSATAVWNNKYPDTAALFDAEGNEVSRKTY